MYYYLYEELKAYCTEFKASLRYIVTRKKEKQKWGWVGESTQDAKGCPHTMLFYLCIVLGGKIICKQV